MRYEQLTMGEAQVGETAEGGFTFRVLKFSASIDPAPVAANVSAEQNFTLTGLQPGDIPIGLQTPIAMATLQVVPVRVDSADTLVVKATNTTAGTIDIVPGQSVTAVVLRPSGL